MVKLIVSGALVYSTLLWSRGAQAQHWNLPAPLTSQSMEITFELDTTWHTVEGKVKELSGAARLVNPKDPRTITASLSIPVSALDTDSESRDEEMRESMEASRFPSITVTVPSLSPGCEERSITADATCPYSSQGAVTIRDVTLPIQLSGTIRRGDAGSLIVEGNTSLDWSLFGVKDPSILIAKVDEQVKIAFRILLPDTKKIR